MVKLGLAASILLAIPVAALTGDQPAKVYSAAEVQTALAQLVPQAKASGSSGSLLTSFGNFALRLSVRTKSGGAEIHTHWDDLMIIEQGTATLITGGTMLESKASSKDEMVGTGIQGGKSQLLKPGDVVVVPAGVPHQLLIPEGTTYAALVAKVKE